MSSTPTISCSSGPATVSEITCGFAPGYEARTTIEGGTTSGYSLIGSLNSESAPAIRMNPERTAANTGRSMKNFEMFMAVHSPASAGAPRFQAGAWPPAAAR